MPYVGPATLGDYDDLSGFSLKGALKGIAKVATAPARAVARNIAPVARAIEKNVTRPLGAAAKRNANVLIPVAAGLLTGGVGTLVAGGIGAAKSGLLKGGLNLLRRKATPGEQAAAESAPTPEVAPEMVAAAGPGPSAMTAIKRRTFGRGGATGAGAPAAGMSIADKARLAGKVIEGGKVVRRKAKDVSEFVRGKEQFVAQLAQKANALAQAGDAVGATQFAAQAQTVANTLSNASAALPAVADSINTAGAAAEGAAAGAVAGAGLAGLPKWVPWVAGAGVLGIGALLFFGKKKK